MSFVACKEVVYINFKLRFSSLNCSVQFTSDFFSGRIFFVVSDIHIYLCVRFSLIDLVLLLALACFQYGILYIKM